MAVFSPEFVAKMRRFMEAREKRDQLKEAAKAAEEEYREFEAEVWEELAPDDPNDPDYKLIPVKIPLGAPWGTVTFGPRETIYGRIIDDEAALEYYDRRAMADDVTAPKFVMARINEEVREKHENGEKMPDGVDYYAKRFVSITRAKT